MHPSASIFGAVLFARVVFAQDPDFVLANLQQSPLVLAGAVFAGSCKPGYIECHDGCIPATSVCCPQSIGACDPGYYCMTGGGCCRTGKTCTGVGGCSAGKVECGKGCMPAGSVCCPTFSNGNGGYCSAGTRCDTVNDKCLAGSGSDPSPTTTRRTTTTSSSRRPTSTLDDDDDDDDDRTSGIASSASDRGLPSVPTASARTTAGNPPTLTMPSVPTITPPVIPGAAATLSKPFTMGLAVVLGLVAFL